MKLINWLILALLFALLITGCGIGYLLSESTPMPTEMPRTVIDSTLPLEEQWRYYTRLPNDSSRSSGLFVTGEEVVMAPHILQGSSYDSLLFALSLIDGRQLWQTRLKDPGFGTSIGDGLIKAETRRLYLEYSFQINAFDLDSGELLWYTPDLGGHTSYAFVPESTNPLLLRTSEEQLIAIDADSGKVLSRKPNPEPLMTLYHGSLIISNTDTGLTVVDRSTGEELWRFGRWYADFWPTIIGDNMLFEFAEWEGRPTHHLVMMNIYTGKGIWGDQEVYISNYAISGSRVYIIHKDGRLLAFDLTDGHLVGEIRFTNAPTMIGSRPYWVGAQGPYVLVYFGDGQELIAFKEQTP